jgi:hypothetical protein
MPLLPVPRTQLSLLQLKNPEGKGKLQNVVALHPMLPVPELQH